MKTPFYYVSVIGVLGAGKTTACNLLAQKFGFHIFEEGAEKNVFLPHFYKDAPRWAFHTQMFYLHERVAQLKKINSLLATTHVVQDSSIYQDRLTYAEAQRRLGNMSNAEFALYEKSFDTLQANLPQPHLIINLEASPKVLLERIRERGRDYEKNVSTDYIKLLSELQSEWTSKHKNLNIVNINMNSLDLAHSANDQAKFTADIGARLGISASIA